MAATATFCHRQPHAQDDKASARVPILTFVSYRGAHFYEIAGSVAGLELGTKIAWYYLHKRVWATIRWGFRDHHP